MVQVIQKDNTESAKVGELEARVAKLEAACEKWELQDTQKEAYIVEL